MNNLIKCTTAEEAYKAIENEDIPEVYGDVSLDIRTNCTLRVMDGSPRIKTYGSSSPDISIEGSSSPEISAKDLSSPNIYVRDLSSPVIKSWNSSRPRIITHWLSILC
jgi:hypothetical protein